jgi:thioredoxin 1
MSVIVTTDNAFAEDVLASSLPVLVEFTADWCPPCKMIAPVLDQIADDEAGRLRVVSLDVDENPAITSHYGIMSMPTLTLFVNGEVVTQFIGAKPRTAIMRLLEPYLTSAASIS